MHVGAVLAVHGTRDRFGERVVEIVAAEHRIAERRGGCEFHAGLHDRGRVERATAEVEHEQAALRRGRVETDRERTRDRLGDELDDVEVRDPRGAHDRVAIAGIRRGRHRDHALLDRAAEALFGELAHAVQHRSGDLLGRVRLGAELEHQLVAAGVELRRRAGGIAAHELVVRVRGRGSRLTERTTRFGWLC